MSSTSIEWTDFSINPIRARYAPADGDGHYCEKISPGCTNCYASRLQPRFGMPVFSEQRRKNVTTYFDAKKLNQISDRKKPTKYFWCDMTDMFGDWVPDAWIDQCIGTMAWTRQHTHQVLTKRAERLEAYSLGMALLTPNQRAQRVVRSCGLVVPDDTIGGMEWPLPNVWFGVSVENQQYAEARIPHLLRAPAAVRFLSAEPLLGQIDLCNLDTAPELMLNALSGMEVMGEAPAQGPCVDWVIVGGESGPRARPHTVRWTREIVRDCRRHHVAVFVKQLGANVIDRNDAGFEGDKPGAWPMDTDTVDIAGRYQGEPLRVRLRDAKGGTPDEWPEDLRVRQFPKSERAS